MAGKADLGKIDPVANFLDAMPDAWQRKRRVSSDQYCVTYTITLKAPHGVIYEAAHTLTHEEINQAYQNDPSNWAWNIALDNLKKVLPK